MTTTILTAESAPRSVTSQREIGKARRGKTPRSSHGSWQPPSGRQDPVELLESQAAERLPQLVPIRYGRMISSPFAFLRGSAIVMAHDLAATPVSGIRVQACGDCHLSNFGIFATPERNIVFDINDFDETLPAPWEWDLKRLATSLVVACRYRGFRAREARAAALAAAQAYRRTMAVFSGMHTLDVWYARLDLSTIMERLDPEVRARTEKGVAKAMAKDHLHALSKLTALVDGRRQIVNQPPLVTRIPLSDETAVQLQEVFTAYLRTLQDDRKELLGRYRFVDLALKVVGVGSVGTRCFIALLEDPSGADGEDPLFLQAKEASRSVLEGHAGRSKYRNHGQRVVCGQRLTQAASDMFLGWTRNRTNGRDFYFRQLRDVKGSIEIEEVRPEGIELWARGCGWVLARAHARSSGLAAAISGYLGTGDSFDSAIADFAEGYADQTERDHAALVHAVESGRVEALTGL
jgi:uncharacterized protein (DUF2252 family)